MNSPVCSGSRPDVVTADGVADVWTLYRRVGEEMRSRLTRVAADYGLSPLHAHLLHVLEPPAAMGAAAGRMCLDASYLTGLADRLEELGLVRRRPDTTDRRVKILEVHAAGRKDEIVAGAEYLDLPDSSNVRHAWLGELAP